MRTGSKGLWRGLWVVLGCSLAFALLSAESCTGDGPTAPRQTCYNLPALDSSSCAAAASRNGCTSHSWNSLVDACTGQECTSCNR